MAFDPALLTWLALAAALVVSPGPDTLLVAGHAARRGFRAGLAAALGIGTGGLWYMALCGFGFLAVLNAIPGLFAVVRTVGALYLAFLGLKLLWGAIHPADVLPPAVLRSGPFRQGLLTTVLNPKVALFFLAVLPQFVGTGPDAPLHGVVLVAIVYALGFVWLTGVAAVTARIGSSIDRGGALRWVEGVLGVAFVGFAGKLAFSRT